MTTYCAPCLADLALVREATTSVGGTASCMAHAVLLVHPHDDPHRRRQRLAQLRDGATEKLETVGPEERLRLEVLIEEYSLASAMESLVPRRRPDGPRERQEGGRPGDAPLSRSARKRRARDTRERAGGPVPTPPSGGPVPAPSGPVADGGAEAAGAAALEQVGAATGQPPAGPGAASDPAGTPSVDAPSADAPSAGTPSVAAPSADAPSVDAPSADAPSADARSADAQSVDAPASSATPPPSLVGAAAPAAPSGRPGAAAQDAAAPSPGGSEPPPAEASDGLASDDGTPRPSGGTVPPGAMSPVPAPDGGGSGEDRSASSD